VAGVSVAGRYGLQAYREWKTASESSKPKENKNEAPSQDTAGGTGSAWGGVDFANLNPLGKRYYDGGFESKMSRREAALVLGVRESATSSRIKDAHRYAT
jgi:DnaJ family protein C protein 19